MSDPAEEETEVFEEENREEMDVEGLSLVSTEIPAPEAPEKPKPVSPRKRRRIVAAVGAIILLFAVIGFVFSLVKAVGWIVRMATNQPEKERFSAYIYPVVMQDPPEFDSVDKLSPNTILASAAWDLILYGDTSKYQRDEFNFITVPQSDLEMHATSLFGEGLTFVHQSIGDAEYSFTNNEEDGTYNISDSLLFFSYIPNVTRIDHVDGLTRLTVEYRVPDTGVGSRRERDEAVKIMEYDLEKRENGEYKITALRTVVSGTAVSNSSAPEESSESSEISTSP